MRIRKIKWRDIPLTLVLTRFSSIELYCVRNILIELLMMTLGSDLKANNNLQTSSDCWLFVSYRYFSLFASISSSLLGFYLLLYQDLELLDFIIIQSIVTSLIFTHVLLESKVKDVSMNDDDWILFDRRIG
jgi:hypothetical protein